MRSQRKLLLLAAVVVGMIMPSAAAAAPSSPAPMDASKRIAGFTAGQLLGEEFRQILELPPDANPLLGNGDNCLAAGYKDKVLILWTTPAPAGPTVCNVKPGTPVFFSSSFVECSSVEDSPFFGATEEEQRQCAVDGLRATPFDAILVSIDGGPAVDIGLDSFLAVSGQGTVELPEPNILGVPDPQATFVAAAYSALVHPLPPGSHTIAVTIVGGDFAGTNRAVVNVVPGLKS